MLHLQQSLGPHVLQVEYIWMTRVLPPASDVLKVIDTHDVFSTIEQKVRMFGLGDLSIDPRDEAERLRRADLIVAIQEEERQELQRLAPAIPVITAGVDFDVDRRPGRCLPRTDSVHCLGQFAERQRSDRLCPSGVAAHPTSCSCAELVVAGGVTQALAGRSVPGITVAGPSKTSRPLTAPPR